METDQKIQDIIAKIKTLSVVEINELVTQLESLFNVKYGNITNNSGATENQGSSNNDDEEKDEVSLILKTVGASKVAVIKLVKDIAEVDLMKAKKITETVPVKIKEKISRSDAAEIAKKFTEIGAETEIK